MAILSALLAIVYHLLGKEKAKRKEAERDAEMAEAVIKQHDKTAASVSIIQKIHRKEAKDVKESLKTDDRTELDNDW